ncbi:MAG: phosphoribosylformylglycinamidine synthase subunit PurQ [Proteobacteria bacterium]|nr:phosphoribosylformylglycinamidine synthase subunit PurQ [Pseudomonadota bacterium]
MRVSIVVFPGSNCDHDVEHVYGKLSGADTSLIWHRERDLKKPDIVVLPGGFAHGDYLRTGALAKLSPVMAEVKRFAESGGPVIGICNGFQILCEAGLLPGVLLGNVGRKFLSQFVHLRVENTNTPFTRHYTSGSVITCPIAHGEGNYFCTPETLEALEGDGQIIFRYCADNGAVNPTDRRSNPNGSLNAIAGICSKSRTVVGLMPHPERASEALVGALGASSGAGMFGG